MGDQTKKKKEHNLTLGIKEIGIVMEKIQTKKA